MIIVTKILNALAILCGIKVILGLWADWVMRPPVASIELSYWNNFIISILLYSILGMALYRRYKFSMVVLLIISCYEMWIFRDLGFSPLLLFSMGIQAKLSMLELLLAVALSIVGIAMWIYPNIKNRGIAHVH